MVVYGRRSSVSPRRRRNYSDSSPSPRGRDKGSRSPRGRGKASRSPRGRKKVKRVQERRGKSSRSPSRSSRSRSQRRSRSKQRNRSPEDSRSPRPRSRARDGRFSSADRYSRPGNKFAPKKKKKKMRAGGGGRNKRNDSDFNSQSVRNKVKRFPRNNSPGFDSNRSMGGRPGGPVRKNAGAQRKLGAKKKRIPQWSDSENEGQRGKVKQLPKRRQHVKKLPWIEDSPVEKVLNRRKRAGVKRGSFSSDESRKRGGIKKDLFSSEDEDIGPRKLGRVKKNKPWSGAKGRDYLGIGGPPRLGRKGSPRLGRKANIPQKKKKVRPNYRKWEDSEDDRDVGFRKKKLTSTSEDDDHFVPPWKKKAAILSDAPALGARKKKKNGKPIPKGRKFQKKKALLANPQPPTPEEPPQEKNKSVIEHKIVVEQKIKPEDDKTNKLVAKLQEEMKKLQDELKEVKNVSIPVPPKDTVAISKVKLAGLLEGKEINDAGGIENAIESLVNKRQELEGELVQMRDKLRKKSEVEKNLEKVKDELQRNLERIEWNSRAMSPNNNPARNHNTIYHLSQRIAALEQEHKEIMRYSLPPAAPVYWRSPQPVHQPVVHIHQPPSWRSQGHHQAKDVYPRQTHFPQAPGDQIDHPNSQHERSSERSFVDGGDIAELCSALAATVDLVKKVISVDT